MCMVTGTCCKAIDVTHAQEEKDSQRQGHVITRRSASGTNFPQSGPPLNGLIVF